MRKANRLLIRGYFLSMDSYGRGELMFLDDLDDLDDKPRAKPSFTKSYVTWNDAHTDGHSPLTDTKTSFIIKLGKVAVGHADTKQGPRVLPIADMLQHSVECIVQVSFYNFKKNGDTFKGWNFRLIKMKLLEF
jgi:hypothetical protein